MQLYLDSYGAYLSTRNGMFCVRTKTAGERLFALREVGAILLTRGTALSTDAALLAAEHDIPVLLIDADTHFPMGQLSSGRSGSIATIRKNQALFARRPEGLKWAAGRIAAKTGNQRALLRKLAERPGLSAEFKTDAQSADRIMASLETRMQDWTPPPGPWNTETQSAAADQLRGQEGTASRLYFQQMSKVLGPEKGFSGRQQRPAYDPFNALLNYLYGMLYCSVHLALLKSGLDPYMGVLHADQYGDTPTLAFDAIEPYRPWADETAVLLMLEGKTGAADFEIRGDKEGLWLSGPGKSTVIEAMLGNLNATVPYGAKNVRRSVQIDLEAQKLAVFLKEFEV
jgi:CRISPR-associated protein Cas1